MKIEGSDCMQVRHPKVDNYIDKDKWQDITKALRDIIFRFDVIEEFKWGKPCYMYENSNIMIIQGFKDYEALMFFKGVLLKDKDNVLHSPGENSQTGRQLRFGSVKEVLEQSKRIKQYIQEAIDNEINNVPLPKKETKEIAYIEELNEQFDIDSIFKEAFESLTPGRQRAYHIFFSGAKQSTTRTNRIMKYKSHILSGKGMMDE